MAEPTLLEALGSPCLESLPPPAVAAEWRLRRSILRARLHAVGSRSGCTPALRTPAAVWAAAGVGALPGRRWPQLAGIWT